VGTSSVKGAIRYLRQGGMVAILCDRDIQKTGQLLPLCGCPARFPVGAAALALHTGAQIVPAFSQRRGPGRNEVWLEPPLRLERTGDEGQDVRAMTQKILARFEEYLRRDPGQWMVLDPVWGQDCAKR
jgi:KDO2-lipid IV(A) lauroyltransferase